MFHKDAYESVIFIMKNKKQPGYSPRFEKLYIYGTSVSMIK